MPRLTKINAYTLWDREKAREALLTALEGHVIHRAMARVGSFEQWEKASADLRQQCIDLEAQSFADDLDRLVRDKDG